MKQLVKLYKRPSRDGQRFTFFLRYDGENGKQKWETLGHGDRRKAERQCAQKEKELRMGYIEHGSMRRGELLNLVWSDVDFEEQTITVSSKNDTKHTWKWLIKDSDHRVLPLTSEITQLLVEHQESQSEGYPYVFVPSKRYDYVQKTLRSSGKWSLSNSRTSLVNNFYRQFGAIRKRARSMILGELLSATGLPTA